ncbi:hypothetical protein HNV12_20265 [Methanococcoides sp. SA1]|nr:hypothetical protein [Methanococcoides sp. SA1]
MALVVALSPERVPMSALKLTISPGIGVELFVKVAETRTFTLYLCRSITG